MQFRKVIDESAYQLSGGLDESITGYLDPIEERNVDGLRFHRFTLHLEPTVEDLDTLLPLMGLAEAPADTFTLEDTLSSFDVLMYRGERYFFYDDTYCAGFVFRHAKGDHTLQLELKCVALALTSEGDADPGMPAFPSGTPYAFPQTVLTLVSTTRAFDRYALAVDHKVIVQHNNSQDATCVIPSAREISLAVSTPYVNATEDLLTDRVGDSDGEGATLVYTSGGFSTTFTFQNLKLMLTMPDILGKDKEIRFDQYYRAFRTVATEALIVTHDATP